jgi:hypothetical protein
MILEFSCCAFAASMDAVLSTAVHQPYQQPVLQPED